jgi:hypothetical protein
VLSSRCSRICLQFWSRGASDTVELCCPLASVFEQITIRPQFTTFLTVLDLGSGGAFAATLCSGDRELAIAMHLPNEQRALLLGLLVAPMLTEDENLIRQVDTIVASFIGVRRYQKLKFR